MWNSIKKIESSDNNVFKYVFNNDGSVVESVLYKYPTFEDRTVICCSTQSGCPVGCRFCGSGDYFVKSLTSEEIVSQPKYLIESNNIDASKVKKGQIMFMSMGEPMLNLKAIIPAIKELNGMYPGWSLLVSTMGPRVEYFDFIELSREIDEIGLQFSIHESTDEKRNLLIPFKLKLTLSEIAQYGEMWNCQTGRKPFFNYCAHEDNTSQKNIDDLLSLFSPKIWNATISVICERDESVAAANKRQEILASDFQTKLIEAGYNTRMFNPAGQDDIGGGCGQLWFVQDWMRNNPDKAKKSCGNGLPKVHTPQ